ncbi:protein-disulfide reductase DsbD [Acinetobacter baylyi]|uniref:protein-disulfide reductase DsbD n=1 Tax=Acinetobacter baylyi TaxID=202950 RepID=UPI0031D884EA
MLKSVQVQKIVAWFFGTILLMLSLLVLPTYAAESLLSPEQAFSFSVESTDSNQAVLSWKIQPNYYLYQHKFEVRQSEQSIRLNLPPATDQYDENFGHSKVYYSHVQFSIKTAPAQHYQVTWQGCAKDRICYPPQTISFQTDQEGLVSQQNTSFTGKKRLTDLTSLSAQATSEQADTPDHRSVSMSSSAVAQDQVWSSKLEQHSLGYGILLFLGLGILLAFTPCSLPMLPILTSLIVREHRGLKAWAVALTFVMSMATVYAVLGLIASSAGLNFQRWLQQPATLIGFSLLFIVFALNLFGLFELKLPQKLINQLDQIQSVQQGGTLLGAAVMGVISALLVGPCMTAPLAGTLLFIAQTQDQWRGALLLFCLGFGMGIPLLIATFLGTKILPKAGQWMHQIKVIFAFIMLALAIYFIRPLLSDGWIQIVSLILGIAFIVYALYRLIKYPDQLKWLYLLLLLVVTPLVAFDQYQHSQRWFVQDTQKTVQWHTARTAVEFKQLLERVPAQQPVIIDVYADWCVACQPIEHRVLKDHDVQQALKSYYLIKLDLSHYDVSHQHLLNEWEILGPPTYLFLDQHHQEIRNLRLTGAFSKNELLQQLAAFKNIQR